MTDLSIDHKERRLLILAPHGKDAALVEAVLGKQAISSAACDDLEHLVREMALGVGALLISEEAIPLVDDPLQVALARQPPWSDLPILLLTRAGANSVIVDRAVQNLGNVTLLERPVRIGALTSAVHSAMRARERQYQTRAHMQEREQADQRKDQFLATLAHELRNPLAPIRNSLTLLRLTGVDPSIAPACDIMDRQVNHLVRLVDDLIEVSRITRGKFELRKQAVDLSSLIAAAVETSRPLLEDAKHELKVTLPAEPVTLLADAVRMAQVLANLLNNAAKYTDPGGRICVEVREEDGIAVVTVSDTGIGISADALPGIFDMFSQVDAHNSRSQSGLGIGLTLVRSLVEMHGGSVTAHSEGPGRGSQFVLRLPSVPRQHDEAMDDPKPAADFPASMRVLVVDDNRDAADTLGSMLEMVGAEVRVVYDGPAALAACETFLPDAILLDLGMPGMSGYEVARQIRNQPRSGDTLLIALTGWGQEKDRRLTEAAGFNYHLIKPVELDALKKVLHSVGRGVKENT